MVVDFTKQNQEKPTRLGRGKDMKKQQVSRYTINKLIDDRNKLFFIQLPFPTTKTVTNQYEIDYYKEYEKSYKQVFPDYYIPENSLWELPLWIGYLYGKFQSNPKEVINLSRHDFDVDTCVSTILDRIDKDSTLCFSPLAQNYSLAIEIIKRLKGYNILVGGNMNPVKHHIKAPLDLSGLKQCFPDMPLVRVFGSHGCIFNCTFCGDVFSHKKLKIETEESIRQQIEQYQQHYPDTKIMFVGDKTFGQCSVKPLLNAVKDYEYDLIVQSRPRLITPKLIDSMVELNVKAIELGFETANKEVCKAVNKQQESEDTLRAIEALDKRGIKTVVNILVGLPQETNETYHQTLEFMESANPWLYNIYNFVPYPLTNLYKTLKSENRIVEDNWEKWLENGQPVFEPYNVSREKVFEWYNIFLKAATKSVIDNR